MSERVKVANISQLPVGKMLRINSKGQCILLANIEGIVYAIDNTCSHEDASLYNGALKGDCVECPLHGSRFSFKTGHPMEEPATEAVRTYPVCVEAGDVYIEV